LAPDPGVEVVPAVARIGGDEANLWPFVHPPEVEVVASLFGWPSRGVAWQEQHVDEAADGQAHVNADPARGTQTMVPVIR
jgi:hypothetical protein